MTSQHRAFIEQSGSITPGHLAIWTTTGVVQDGGVPTPPAGTTPGVGAIIIADYTVQISDSQLTLQLGTGTTGFFTVTIPSSTVGFATNFKVTLFNGDTEDTKLITGSTVTGLPFTLWPQQTIELQVINGSWQFLRPFALWVGQDNIWDVKERYNLDNTGQTDNAAKLALLAADLAAIEATTNYPSGYPSFPPSASPMPKCMFSPGVYAFSTWPNFAFNNLWMEASGQVELWRRGVFASGVTGNVFGDAFTFDGNPGHALSTGKLYLTFKGFRLVPVGTSSDSLVLNCIFHSDFDRIHVQGAGILAPGQKCVNLKFCVIVNFDHLEISAFNNITSILVPTAGGQLTDNYAIYLTTDDDFGQASSACTFFNPVIEGTKWGVFIGAAGGCNFYNGTIEGCATAAIQIDSPLGSHNFYGLDIEANGTDVICGAASLNNTIINCGDGATLSVSDAGTNNIIMPLLNQFNQSIITVQPSATKWSLDASSQAGIAITSGSSAPVTTGQGVLVIITNMSSTSSVVALAGGGGIGAIHTGGNWQINTTTPAGGNQSLAFDGSSFYRIYNNTGGPITYKVQTFRTG